MCPPSFLSVPCPLYMSCTTNTYCAPQSLSLSYTSEFGLKGHEKDYMFGKEYLFGDIFAHIVSYLGRKLCGVCVKLMHIIQLCFA